MEQAKSLRRTILRLAKEVDKHHDRISVSHMLDLSAGIKRSASGTNSLHISFDVILPLFITVLVTQLHLPVISSPSDNFTSPLLQHIPHLYITFMS